MRCRTRSSFAGKYRKSVGLDTSAAAATSATDTASNPLSTKRPMAMSDSDWIVRCFLRSRRPVSTMRRPYAGSAGHGSHAATPVAAQASAGMRAAARGPPWAPCGNARAR